MTTESHKEVEIRILPIEIRSCRECVNARSTMDSEGRIKSHYCIDLKLQGFDADIADARANDAFHTNCPLTIK